MTGASYETFNILMNGRFVRFEADFGLVVESDGHWIVVVKVPDEYRQQVEGLCGDFNGSPINDLVTSDNNDVQYENNPYAKFGDSWQVEDPTDKS